MTLKADRVRARNAKWFPAYVPAHVMYHELVRSVLRESRDVLHLGAGRDLLGVRDSLSPLHVNLVSLDMDWRGLAVNRNRMRVVGDAGCLPFRAGSFDLVLCEHVFEHLEHPLAMLHECHRCLRPGGAIVFLCPNRFSYLSLLSRLTPHWLHVAVRRRFHGVNEHNTFRTYYRLNSARQIRRLAAMTGFRVERLQTYVGWPTYWEFSDLLHRCSVVVHRYLERLPPWAHITLVGVLRWEEQLPCLP